MSSNDAADSRSRGRPTPRGGNADQTAARGMNRVRAAVAVMSGKGGVGKSLVVALLAAATRRAGYSVGVLDADITGPSIPTMFGLRQRPEGCEIGLLPVATGSGIRVMSLNLLLDRPDDPVIWRGPLLANAVKQFWEQVVWGDLDLLVVDLPPGTSDVPLTVMQSLPLSGLLLVSTPQELVEMIVGKAIRMAGSVGVPVLGLVENMTHLVCPHCGERTDLFGRREGASAARAGGIPVLARIPVDPELSELCDRGRIESYQRNPFQDDTDLLESLLHETRVSGGARP